MFAITIIVNGVPRTYKGDYDDLYNQDWDQVVRDLIDTVKDNQDAEDL